MPLNINDIHLNNHELYVKSSSMLSSAHEHSPKNVACGIL